MQLQFTQCLKPDDNVLHARCKMHNICCGSFWNKVPPTEYAIVLNHIFPVTMLHGFQMQNKLIHIQDIHRDRSRRQKEQDFWNKVPTEFAIVPNNIFRASLVSPFFRHRVVFSSYCIFIRSSQIKKKTLAPCRSFLFHDCF